MAVLGQNDTNHISSLHHSFFNRTSDISNEVMKLINDASKNGQVLAITKNPDDRTLVKVENVELK
jgi:hypothetical protein